MDAESTRESTVFDAWRQRDYSVVGKHQKPLWANEG